MDCKLPKNRKGFTLIELLVVIGILTVLLSIVLIAINPAKQFAQANNTQRRSDTSAILNAVHQYAADNSGAVPTGITTSAKSIGSGASDADICSDLVQEYIAEMPVDPTAGTWTDCSSYTTGYSIVKSAANNRITVTAGSAELGEVISITR
jgi:prepilin-type N-terminal cleavage/methylation domain-containing protein